MITKDKVTEIFCIIDEFDKNLTSEMRKNLCLPSTGKDGKRRRNRKGRLSQSEIMTILVCYHFGTYRSFKEYYLGFVKGCLRREFPDAVSVELMPRTFVEMMLFMKLYAFGKCTGITFVDSTMLPVCHNVRRYFNKVFDGLAKDDKGTMGWCHGFKLHLMCNDCGDIITFCVTGANVDDRDERVWNVFTRELYGKVCHRVHQRAAQEQGQPCAFKASLSTQLHHEHLFCIDGILLLRQQAGGIACTHRKDKATGAFLTLLIPNSRISGHLLTLSFSRPCNRLACLRNTHHTPSRLWGQCHNCLTGNPLRPLHLSCKILPLSLSLRSIPSARPRP